MGPLSEEPGQKGEQCRPRQGRGVLVLGEHSADSKPLNCTREWRPGRTVSSVCLAPPPTSSLPTLRTCPGYLLGLEEVEVGETHDQSLPPRAGREAGEEWHEG